MGSWRSATILLAVKETCSHQQAETYRRNYRMRENGSRWCCYYSVARAKDMSLFPGDVAFPQAGIYKMPIPSHPITSGQPIRSPSNPFLCLGNWEHLFYFFPTLVFHFHLNVWSRAAPVATACSAFWSSTAQNSDCIQNHSIHPSFHFEGKIQSTKQEQGGWGVCSTCS